MSVSGTGGTIEGTGGRLHQHTDTSYSDVGHVDNPFVDHSDTPYFIDGPPGSYFTITSTADTNSTVDPVGSVNVTSGSSQKFDYAPKTGFTLSHVWIDGVGTGTDVLASDPDSTSYTFTNVTSDHTIDVISNTTYKLTPSASNATITPNTEQTVASGTSKKFDYSANSGYKITHVWIDGNGTGTDVVTTNPSTYTFNNVTANHTIDVIAILETNYSITPSTDGYCSITPNTTQVVASGSTVTFNYSPNAGSTITHVWIDGECTGLDVVSSHPSSYTFTNVQGNHTILVVTNNTIYYYITPSVDSNGTINPSTVTMVRAGTSKTFYYSGVGLYRVAHVWIDSSADVKSSNNTDYTFYDIQSNHTIDVTTEVITYTITATFDEYTNLTPNGVVLVEKNANQTFTYSAKTGCTLTSVKVDNLEMYPLYPTSYPFYSVSMNHTIAVKGSGASKHTDVAHSNSWNDSSGVHSNTSHSDSHPYTDSGHTNTDYNDVYNSAGFTDSPHNDNHADTPFGNITFSDQAAFPDNHNNYYPPNFEDIAEYADYSGHTNDPFADVPEHNDGYTDTEHGDTPYNEHAGFSDVVVHGDYPHADTPAYNDNTNYTDIPHSDYSDYFGEPYSDTEGFFHNDTPHQNYGHTNTEHADTPFADCPESFTNTPHTNEAHIDSPAYDDTSNFTNVAHTDEPHTNEGYIDRPHSDNHTDYEDAAYFQNTPHTDIPFSNTAHSDYTDGVHVNNTHVNQNGTHSNTAHSDSHSDS